VAWLPNPGDPASLEVVDYATWLAQQPGRDPVPGVWLDIEDVQIVNVDEQYVPLITPGRRPIVPLSRTVGPWPLGTFALHRRQ
jgi:hypothetical protein